MPRTTTRTRRGRARSARLVAALMAAGLLMAACGGDDDSSETSDDGGGGQAASDPYGGGSDDSSSTTASDAGATGAATVDVASDDELGDFLVGPDGNTLYLFEEDQGTTTACTAGCADTWPPLVSAAPTGGDGVDADELSTADGIEPDQVTYHGHLLYYFAGDEAPGDTNGTAVPSWYAVDPTGEAIGES